ncbi:MAG: hypothetical protein QOI35_901, partial [Cryptosporangiaceae bacterium]|nr:hypothetical protein [Cryptosporangiaceae bacterium]
MPVQEQDGGGQAAGLLSSGTDQWLSRTDSAGQRTFLTDATGSTIGLTDGAGA